jgi:hypothetical protein
MGSADLLDRFLRKGNRSLLILKTRLRRNTPPTSSRISLRVWVKVAQDGGTVSPWCRSCRRRLASSCLWERTVCRVVHVDASVRAMKFPYEDL